MFTKHQSILQCFKIIKKFAPVDDVTKGKIAQLVNHLPAMQETWVQYLGWEDPLEKEMATHSSIFAWKIPWTEDPGRLQSTGLQESDMT